MENISANISNVSIVGDESIDVLMNSAIRAQDNMVRECQCHSICLTKRCPCRAVSMNCKASCQCGTKKRSCQNNKQVTENSDDSEDSNEDNSDDDDATEGSRGPSRKRSRPDEGDNDGDLSIHLQRLRLQDRLIQDFVDGLAVDALKRICTDLLRRSPGAYSDYVAMGSNTLDGTDVDEAYMRHINQRGDPVNQPQEGDDLDTSPVPEDEIEERHQQFDHPQPNPVPRGPPQPLPWCRCTLCRPMPTQLERKCCRPRRGHHCISTTGEFARLCLDNMVLEVAMRVHEDLLAEDQVRNNAAYRHQAYRVYIYWQHGRLGAGNRRVIPSCVVWAIRDMWPEPTGVYKGFIEGIGHLGD